MLAQPDHEGLDRGPRTTRDPARRCALTRTVKPADEMIRFVVAPDGEVVADVRKKLPGRGLWITASRPCLDEAVRRNIFAQGFKRQVRVLPTLPQDTDRLLAQAALDALSIAAKAGEAVAGFAKVERILTNGEAVALIHASDGGKDGARKLDALARPGRGESDRPALINVFSSEQLDLALGRPNVVHAALLAGPASATFLQRCRRLAGFRESGPGGGQVQAEDRSRRHSAPRDDGGPSNTDLENRERN